MRGKFLVQFFRNIHLIYFIGLITASPTRGLKCSHLSSVLATSRSFVIVHSETIGLTGTDLMRYAKRHSKHECGSIFFFAMLCFLSTPRIRALPIPCNKRFHCRCVRVLLYPLLCVEFDFCFYFHLKHYLLVSSIRFL